MGLNRLGIDFIYCIDGSLILPEINGFNSGSTGLQEVRNNADFMIEEYKRIKSAAGDGIILIDVMNPYGGDFLSDHFRYHSLWDWAVEKHIRYRYIARIQKPNIDCYGQIRLLVYEPGLNDRYALNVSESVVYPQDIGAVVTSSMDNFPLRVRDAIGRDKFLNDPNVERITEDKILGSTLLSMTDSRKYVPNFIWTFGCPSLGAIKRAFRRLDSDRIVVKPTRGSQGDNVVIFDASEKYQTINETYQLFQEYKHKHPHSLSRWIIQRFHESTHFGDQRDIIERFGAFRAIYLAGSYMHSYLRLSRNDVSGDLNNLCTGVVNYSKGAISVATPDYLEERIIKATNKIGSDFEEAALQMNRPEAALASLKYLHI